eukprot:gene17446-biopygen807
MQRLRKGGAARGGKCARMVHEVLQLVSHVFYFPSLRVRRSLRKWREVAEMPIKFTTRYNTMGLVSVHDCGHLGLTWSLEVSGLPGQHLGPVGQSVHPSLPPYATSFPRCRLNGAWGIPLGKGELSRCSTDVLKLRPPVRQPDAENELRGVPRQPLES